MNEQNQKIEGLALHDVIVISKHQRTAEDGKKKGYSWGKNDSIGIITQLSDQRLVMITPNREDEVYDPEDEDKDYFYTIGRGSDIEFLSQIDKALKEEVEKRDEMDEKIKTLLEWRHDFEHSFSFIGKLVRFIKQFQK